MGWQRPGITVNDQCSEEGVSAMRLKGFLMTLASTIAGTFDPNILLFDVLPMTSTILSAPRKVNASGIRRSGHVM